MTSGGSITECISGLRRGNDRAAQALWERYWERLVRLVRCKLKGHPQRVADEEDVVLSALDSFCRGAREGRFPRLSDRHDLWQVIVMLTARKAARYLQHQGRKKRGGSRVRGESVFVQADGQSDIAGIAQVVGDEPTPEFAAEVAEECRRLLDLLPDETLRRVALWKMEGYTNLEIAAKLRRTERTVERKLDIIRKHWSGEG